MFESEQDSKGPNYRIVLIAVGVLVACITLLLGLLFFFGILSWSKRTTSAGEPNDKQIKTKIEEFQAKTGAVIVKGYTTIGTVSDMGTVEVTAMEFTEAASGGKSTGVSIEVKESGDLEKKQTSFIDYDEIDSLISGIDYVSRANSSLTKHKNFESTYVTKGCFKVTAFNDEKNSLQAAVSGGCIMPTQAFLPAYKLSDLRSLLVEAKRSIDAGGR